LIPLIGREQEKGEICELLAQPEVRLLTLTGTGGIGKTRLASQVGADLQDEFDHGICFVQLAPILNPDLILPTIAHTLGLQENDDQPQMTRLISFLRDKHMLLLLDNFEQVLPAAPLLSHLLSFCPLLKFLVTSRAKLHIQDEYVFPVKPLALPDITNDFSVDAIAQYPAITLFTKRTQAIYPEFQLTENNAQSVAEICRLLDGLPLAIELAAARIKLLTPQKLYSRLKQHRLTMLVGGKQDVPLRQQTLKNTLQWSYTLLTGEEQILFQRCCVFVKSFTLEAIEFVCNSIGDLRTPVIDLVASLIDKSLILQLEITRDEQRLYLLSLIREFGMEMLHSSEEWDKMRAAHATYYLNLANEATQGLVGSEQAHWLELLKPELENIRAALLFLQENGEIEAALQLAASLQLFWMQSGYMSEGRHFLEQLVVISRERKASVETSVVAQALYIISWLAYWQNDLEQAETFLAECEESGRSLGDKKSIADALHYQGNIAFDRGDIGKAITKHEESLKLYRESGDRKGTAKILLAMGTHALYSSDYPRAKALCQESLELVRDTGDSWQMAVNLQYLGWASYELGEYEAALVLSEESMAIFGTLGQSSFAVDAHIVLASIARIFEEQERAHALLQEALALSREMKSKEDTGRVLCRSGQLFLREGNLETAQSLYDESVNLLKASWKISRNKWAMAASLEGLGEIVLAQGQPAWTVQLFASAETVRAANGYHTSLGIEQPFYDQTLAQARASIDKVSFDALWTKGQSMAPEQALRLEIRERDLQSHTTTVPVPTNEQTSFAHLTRRELEVLKLLTQGMTNAQIAESLTISLSTVDTHLRSIYNKLGVSSRVQAARYSIMHQLPSWRCLAPL
jgi:predicted ATPase/DNA-binding CsgD family transcriptional regulator